MAYIVDMRSDTVTKPTKAMKHAMVNSALGDDVFGEDPTVNALESKIAASMGKPAALFVPSGTMSNLIAIMVHCNKRGSEVIVGDKSHIYKYEQGGAAHVGGCQLSAMENNPDGTFDLEKMEKRIRGTDIHEPITSLVCVENTHNVCGGKVSKMENNPGGTLDLEKPKKRIRGTNIHEPIVSLVCIKITNNVHGGKVLPMKWLADLSTICKKHSLPIHVDGARIFNAAAYLNVPVKDVVKGCDSISVCFSKGLSCPVGSALVGSVHFIEQARRVRKMLGGGMRQAGVLAACALVALDEVVPQLSVDHKRAQRLAKVIEGMFLKCFTVDVNNQHTNIVLVKLTPRCPVDAGQVVHRLAQVSLQETQGDCKTANDEGVILKSIIFDNETIRLTLHNGITDEDLWLAIMKITYVFKEMEAKAETKPTAV